MTHPLKQRINKLTSHQLDQLESVLGAVLHQTELRAEALQASAGQHWQEEQWPADHAVADMWIAILRKALGVEPEPEN